MQCAGIHQLACLLVLIQIGLSFSKEMCIFLSLMEFFNVLKKIERWRGILLLMMILIPIFFLIPIMFVRSYIYLFSSSVIRLMNNDFDSDFLHVCLFNLISRENIQILRGG